ncbi:MAG: hypothetical protein ACI88L_000421 [Candidatus Paceibacteria bacterium]|jgi:hypothetical protein
MKPMKINDAFFSWEAHEEIHIERGNDWYWGLGLLGIFGSAGAFLVGNFLFGIFIILSAAVLFLFSKNKEEIKLFQITNQGIQRGDTLYPYKSVKSFWVDTENEQEPALVIHTSRIFDPVIAIPISLEIPTEDLRMFLRNLIHEEYLQEPRFHKILDKIGL